MEVGTLERALNEGNLERGFHKRQTMAPSVWQYGFRTFSSFRGTRWHSWLRHCATSRKVAGSIPDFVIGIFLWHNPHYGPGVESASNRNEYQEYFLGVKAAVMYGWQPYQLHVPIVLKFGRFRLLELSERLQACNGNALLLLSILMDPWRNNPVMTGKILKIYNFFRSSNNIKCK